MTEKKTAGAKVTFAGCTFACSANGDFTVVVAIVIVDDTGVVVVVVVVVDVGSVVVVVVVVG